jgi:hypothetical protein
MEAVLGIRGGIAKRLGDDQMQPEGDISYIYNTGAISVH